MTANGLKTKVPFKTKQNLKELVYIRSFKKERLESKFTFKSCVHTKA